MNIHIFQRAPMPESVRSAMGKKFGRLTIVGYVGKERDRFFVMCRCDCGDQKVTDAASVRRGAVKSCGCLHRESAANTGKRNATHGLSRNRAYRIWRDMHTRCENPKFKFYRYYGGRGIRVCSKWTGKGGFDVFIAEMGMPKPGDTLERKDNDKDYSRSNCKWIPWRDQAKNRRHNWQILGRGKIMTASEASKVLGRSKGFCDARLRKGGFRKDVIIDLAQI